MMQINFKKLQKNVDIKTEARRMRISLRARPVAMKQNEWDFVSVNSYLNREVNVL